MAHNTLKGLIAAVCVLALTPLSAIAQNADNAIVVTGRTPEQAARFVQQMSIAADSADQLARWDTSVCTSVAGLPARQAQFIADRIAQRAHGVGLSPGAAGCTANVAIVVSADANAAARRLFDQDPNLFAYRPEENQKTLGQAAFQDFLETPRAVRWWHIAETMTADGLNLSGDAAHGGRGNVPVTRSSGSRLSNSTRQDLRRVIIIVDAHRVGATQLATLADYLAMVALAQVNPHADMSAYPSIMSVFADPPSSQHVTALTDWDLGYLDGLYHATRNAANVAQQRREIALRMTEHS